MKVRVLGCHGGVAPGYQTTSYYINEDFLIDCGSACETLTPKEQSSLSSIFITHPHLDHVKDICFLLENTFAPDKESLTLRSTPEILEDVQKHLLNDVLWPDFSKIYLDPKKTKPAVVYETLKKEETLNGVKVTYFHVNHPGNAIGFLLEDAHSQVLFTGDSGPCEQIWKIANKCQNLKAVFSEISFPSRMDGLARAAGHFTTDQLLEDAKQLRHKNIPFYISHFKPLYVDELLQEFHSKAPNNWQLMHHDEEFNFT